VVVVCGTLQDTDVLASQENIIYAHSILNEPMSLSEALSNTISLVEQQGMLLGKFLTFYEKSKG
jgi:glycerate kinase